MIAGLLALGALVAAGAGAAAGPLEECVAASENRVAASACLELRVDAAGGDLAAATEAAREHAAKLVEATGRDAVLEALAASEAAFEAYLAVECARRAAVVDPGTGAGDVARGCDASLRIARADQLWAEVGGRPATPERIASRAWRLVAIDGEPVIEGTTPDLTLGEDDRAGGDAGTNRWFAPYHLQGMGIAFGTTGATMMFNDEPPGRMDQESRYLAHLSDVNRWRLVGGRLELMADDATLLEFE